MTKQELRKLYKQKRKELTDEERGLLSQLIADNLFSSFDLKGKKVSIFLPIERLFEINTWNIIDHLDAQFYVPVVQGKMLKHIHLQSKDQLEESEWGIPEPTYGEEVKAAAIDVVLVPLLICDKEGNRVGYGAGFYDGFLKDCRTGCQFLGLSYFEPIEKVSGAHEADIPLNYCITPNSVHQFH